MIDRLLDSFILEQTPVIGLNPNNTISRWNNSLSTLYGWTPAEALGVDVHGLLKTVFPCPLEEIEAQLTRDGEWSGALTQRKKDGSYLVVASRWVLCHDEAGQVGARLYFVQNITAEKAVEEALTTAQARTDSILESVADSHILFDRQWHYLYVNNSAVSEMGRPRDQILGCTLWELYPDIHGTALERNYRRAMEQRVAVTFDFHYPGRDTWWNNRFLPAPVGLAVFATNITERRRAEEKARAAERFSQAAIDSLPASLCVIDEQGVIIYTNRAWREFARANSASDPAAYLGVNYLAVCDSVEGAEMEDARTIGEGIRQVMRRELSNFSYEYACDSSIESRWFIAEVTRFRIGDSERLLIAHNNITERKWSDLRISQLTRHYQDLFENSGTNIIIVDENDRYLLVNNKAAQSFGVAREDILGKSMADLLPLQTAVRYHEKNRQLLQAGGSREYEDTFTMPGGEITYLIVDQCIQDETGRNFAIQSSSIDITARKKIEQALLESRERLTRLSHYLVETQEQERRRIARELHDEIGQTLTALTIALSGISKAAPDAVFARNLEGLNSLTHDLVQQVGALSSELRPRVLDDLGLVPGLVSLINRLAAQTGIEIDFKHGPLGYISPEIETTAYRIIQESLTNVIRHAQVRLAAVRIQLDSGSLWIQVQDGGVGFEYQVAIRSAGSMGLMSMQERAELVGGSFSIQTAQGEGTSITCRLPLGDLPIERRSHDRD